MRDTQIVIVTGLSGSGKSVAIKCFEDLGFYCIDNLPTVLLPTFAELCAHAGTFGASHSASTFAIEISRSPFQPRSVRFGRQVSPAKFCSWKRAMKCSPAVTAKLAVSTRWRSRCLCPKPSRSSADTHRVTSHRGPHHRHLGLQRPPIARRPGLVVHRGESLAAHDHLGPVVRL